MNFEGNRTIILKMNSLTQYDQGKNFVSHELHLKVSLETQLPDIRHIFCQEMAKWETKVAIALMQ